MLTAQDLGTTESTATPVAATMEAAHILAPSHPLNGPFTKWLKGKSPSKRQARKYLSAYPALRKVHN